MPRTVDHDARRLEVATLAASLVAERGIGVSIRDVAAEGGFSTTVVTHYFADKRELLEHVFELTVGEMAARVAERTEGAEDPVRELCAALLPLDDEALRVWRAWTAFFGAALGDPALAALQRRRVRSQRAAVAAAIAADPAMRPGVDAEGEARTLVALVHGVATQAAFDPEGWPAERQLAPFDAALARLRGP